MLKREAPSRTVPRVFAEDGGGYALPARCVHCGKRIARATLAWGRLRTDPEGLKRPAHLHCLREYDLFAAALDICD
jgi:hypothetical protein